MPVPKFITLGQSALIGDDEEITHLPSQTAWALLASLALDPETDSVTDLGLRFWPDARDPNANFRSHLSILRRVKALGPDAFERERGFVRLRPGVLETDIAELEALRDAVSDTTDPEKRLALLREAYALCRGTVLAPYERRVEDDWLARIQLHTDKLQAEIAYLLALALEARGERTEAFLAANHAFFLRPEQEEIQEAVFRLADGRQEKTLLRGTWRKSGEGDILEHLETWERAEIRPGYSDIHALTGTLTRRLSALPVETAHAFRRLSVFPQAFTAKQAVRICGADEAALSALVASGLLRRIGDDSGERFEMPAAVRQVVRKRLAFIQRQRLTEKHTSYFVLIDGDGVENWSCSQIAEWISAEQSNWMQALDVALQRPFDKNSYDFVNILFQHSQHAPELRKYLNHRIIDRLEECLQTAIPYPRHWPATFLACIAICQQDFEKAIRYLQSAIPLYDSLHQGPFVSDGDRKAIYIGFFLVLNQLLFASHHAGKDRIFDEAVALSFTMLEQHGQQTEHSCAFRWSVLQTLAENQYARRQVDAALETNAKAGQLLRHLNDQWGWGTCNWAAHYYQRGCILRVMERYDEALEQFDLSLMKFREKENGQPDTHGIADCFQSIGEVLGNRGMLAMARENVERAIAIYTELNELGSRAAALGTLGDLLTRSGDREAARRLFAEGLNYWHAENHPRWIANFEGRLSRLDVLEVNGS